MKWPAKLKLVYSFGANHPYHQLSPEQKLAIKQVVDAEVLTVFGKDLLEHWENLTIQVDDDLQKPESEVETAIRNEVASAQLAGISLAPGSQCCVQYNYHGGEKCCKHEYALYREGQPWVITQNVAGIPFSAGLAIALQWEEKFEALADGTAEAAKGGK